MCRGGSRGPDGRLPVARGPPPRGARRRRPALSVRTRFDCYLMACASACVRVCVCVGLCVRVCVSTRVSSALVPDHRGKASASPRRNRKGVEPAGTGPGPRGRAHDAVSAAPPGDSGLHRAGARAARPVALGRSPSQQEPTRLRATSGREETPLSPSCRPSTFAVLV